MSRTRQLRLGAFMRPVSIHTGAWRYPGAYPDANFNFAHIKRFAQRLEAAKLAPADDNLYLGLCRIGTQHIRGPAGKLKGHSQILPRA